MPSTPSRKPEVPEGGRVGWLKLGYTESFLHDYAIRQKMEARQLIQQTLVEKTVGEDWELPHTTHNERAEWVVQRMHEAVVMLQESVEINPRKRGECRY